MHFRRCWEENLNNFVFCVALISREQRLEKSGIIHQKQGIPLLCTLENGQFQTRILASPPSHLFLEIQLQFYCINRNYSLKSENMS